MLILNTFKFRNLVHTVEINFYTKAASLKANIEKAILITDLIEKSSGKLKQLENCINGESREVLCIEKSHFEKLVKPCVVGKNSNNIIYISNILGNSNSFSITRLPKNLK